MLNIQPLAHQDKALMLLRGHWKSDRTFLLDLPTGAGKTAVSAFIVDGFVRSGLRVMFICPYVTLIEQTATRFVQYGMDSESISYMWRDHPLNDLTKPIIIASADTLIRRQMPKDIDLIIIDEAHLKRKRILTFITETPAKVIGLSATPFATFMGQYYGTLIKPTSLKELIQQGQLSSYEFYAPVKPNLQGVKTTNTTMGNDYNENDLSEIMCGSDLVGNVVQNWLEHGQNLSTICFCVNVKHANYVTDQFNQSGVNAEIMTAGTPMDERRLIISRFESGITKIIVNVGVLVAGFDSDVRCIIYARPTRSKIRWVQCIGRGLRTAQGKEKCIIFDHSGTVHRLGFPDDISYDTLSFKDDGMSEAKKREQAKREKKPKECPECKYVKPIGIYTCPKCGFEPKVMEDIDTDETRKIQKVSGKKTSYSKEEKQFWWSQILFYRHRTYQLSGKYYQDGWCANIFKSKFGVWPRGLNDTYKETGPEVNNYITSRHIAYRYRKQPAQNSLNIAGGGIQ